MVIALFVPEMKQHFPFVFLVAAFTFFSCALESSDETESFLNSENSYRGSFETKEGFGYGRVERVQVYSSTRGRTGNWWCEQHFGQNLGGHWSCRSVSGQTTCSDTAPLNAVVSCSLSEQTQSVNTQNNSRRGRTGEWWCDNHFGRNIPGQWDCVDIDGDNRSCNLQAPNNVLVTCARVDEVDEAPFAPPACDSSQLDDPEQVFCRQTEYMRNRERDTVYIYNNHVRAGLSRSFGGALFELYGHDRINKIEEHGGAAVQLSIWGYDNNNIGTQSALFVTNGCDNTPYSSQADCRAANDGEDCSRYPQGSHVSDCSTERSCNTWSAGAPWNPIQAQATDCGWNGPSNDVSTFDVTQNGGVRFAQTNPVHFTKTTNFEGMNWQVTASTPNGKPYVELGYQMDYLGEHDVSIHNQEIPAIFADNRIHHTYFYYDGDSPYQNPRSAVAQKVYQGERGYLHLPNRTADKPLPEYDMTLQATEDWLTLCDENEAQCLTVASFDADTTAFALKGHYITALGRFELGKNFNKNWKVYLFPYRFDDVVAGKSIRGWIHDLKQNQ